jgi:hypothetical protein
MTLSLLLACAAAGAPEATEVDFDNTRSESSATTVQGALDELFVRCRQEAPEAANTDALVTDLNALAARVQALELKFAEASGDGTTPPLTTDARNVEQVLAALNTRVEAIEKGQAASMGSAGESLFELRDRAGNKVKLEPAQQQGQKGGPGQGQPGGPQGGRAMGPDSAPRQGEGGQGGGQGGGR